MIIFYPSIYAGRLVSETVTGSDKHGTAPLSSFVYCFGKSYDQSGQANFSVSRIELHHGATQTMINEVGNLTALTGNRTNHSYLYGQAKERANPPYVSLV